MEQLQTNHLSRNDQELVKDALVLLENSQRIIKNKMNDFFFDENGTVRLTEREVLEWVADRAIDEYKVGYKASELMNKYGHLMEPWLVNEIGEQVEEETRHYRMLYTILPKDLKNSVKEKIQYFPDLMQEEHRWNTLLKDYKTDYTSALFEISIVFEGFASAAIQPVLKLPYKEVADTYKIIIADEESHHSIGLEFIERIVDSSEQVEKLHQTALEAVERAKNCRHYKWT